MTTNRDDDYLICKHYYNHIDNVSSDYPNFITFEHNDNHYFAWVNDGKVILRSEAYPDHEKMTRGIKAILKNKDIYERYSIDSQHGAHFLVLWGGGDHQKHTGNLDKHNEIGRSCPVKDKEDLYTLLGFMGDGFADRVFGRKIGGNNPKSNTKKSSAAVAGTSSLAASGKTSKKKTKHKESKTKVASTTASSSKTKTTVASTKSSEGSGFKWWYLLPLLLLPLFLWWKGCDDKEVKVSATKVELPTAETPVVDTKIELSSDDGKAEVEAAAAAAAAAQKAAADREAAEAKKAEAANRRKANGISGTTSENSTRGNKNSGF